MALCSVMKMSMSVGRSCSSALLESTPTDCHANSPLALSGQLGIMGTRYMIVSVPRTTRNVKMTSRLHPEWRKISGTSSSSTK